MYVENCLAGIDWKDKTGVLKIPNKPLKLEPKYLKFISPMASLKFKEPLPT